MKHSDDYKAKIQLWVEKTIVLSLLPCPPLPPFRSIKFRSYEEMNQWKRQLLRDIATAR